MAIAAFSEKCVAKLVHRVLLLYLVVSSALEHYNSEKRAARLKITDAAINLRLAFLASIIFNNNHGRSLPTLRVSL